jgi:type II secretory pathway pseudopilin PulG
MAFFQHPLRSQHQTQRGYILLTLMLFVAMLSIAAVAIVPSITFQVRRDREQELIHRGVQYSRAIRKYYKKFGRYPTRLKDLDNTNNIRFLRQHYKDPITGQPFKLLHFGDVKLMGGGGIPGATSVAALASAGNAGATAGNKGFSLESTASQKPAGQGQPDKGEKEDNAGSSATSSEPEAPGSASQPTSSRGGLSSQVFGGGPIVGVVSTSKAQSIREFNHKDHYNEWQFIYDPSTDRGGLLNTPAQPPLQMAAPNLQTNPSNVPGGFGAPASGFGSNTGSMGPGAGSFGTQTPAQNPPQQSQPQR